MISANADAPWRQHQLVFVGGLHRSGTTLLADLIAGASNASGLTGTDARMDEGQYLQDVYPIGQELGGPSRWAFDPRAHVDEQDAARLPDAAERLWQSWSPYWDLDASHLVEKTPLNLTKTRFLQAVFPDAKFVMITRHPLAQSLAVRKWVDGRSSRVGLDFHRLIEHWLVAHERFEQDRTRLRQVTVMSYEGLLSDPQTAYESLAAFLGLDGGDERLDRIQASTADRYARQWNEFRRAADGVAAQRPGVDGLARRQLVRLLRTAQSGRIAAQYGRRIARFGYRLDDLVSPPRTPVAVAG